jgi:benzil reductase ((S)-benzoin forming)
VRFACWSSRNCSTNSSGYRCKPGIGLSLVQQLLEDRIKVIAVVRDRASLDALRQKYPDYLEIIEADLSSLQGPLHVADCIQESKIDYLVHNAAIIEPLGKEALIEAPISELNRILQINLVTPILLTASLNPKLTAGSRILNISSRAGEEAGPGLGPGFKFSDPKGAQISRPFSCQS